MVVIQDGRPISPNKRISDLLSTFSSSRTKNNSKSCLSFSTEVNQPTSLPCFRRREEWSQVVNAHLQLLWFVLHINLYFAKRRLSYIFDLLFQNRSDGQPTYRPCGGLAGDKPFPDQQRPRKKKIATCSVDIAAIA